MNLHRPSKDSLLALVATALIMVAIFGAAFGLFLLVQIRSVQHSNGGILMQINTIVGNHTSTLNQLANICHAIKGCVVISK